MTTTQPIRLETRSPREFSIAGTPADCVRIALTHLCENASLVLSGINAEAIWAQMSTSLERLLPLEKQHFTEFRGVAISQYKQGKTPIDWGLSAFWASKVLAKLQEQPHKPGTFWNVNLPYLQEGTDPAIVFCKPCTQPLPADFRLEGNDFYYCGEYAKRRRDPGSDVDVCLSGGNCYQPTSGLGFANVKKTLCVHRHAGFSGDRSGKYHR